MDLTLYALLKNKIRSSSSGITSHSVDGNTLNLTFADGTSESINLVTNPEVMTILKLENTWKEE